MLREARAGVPADNGLPLYPLLAWSLSRFAPRCRVLWWVLGVGLGAIPFVCRDLVTRDPRWREMVEHVKTVATQAFQIWRLPDTANIDAAQVNMVSPQSSAVDGKVWTQNNGFAGVHRLDVASGAIATFEPFKDLPRGTDRSVYGIKADSQNNLFFMDFSSEYIGRVDAKT